MLYCVTFRRRSLVATVGASGLRRELSLRTRSGPLPLTSPGLAL